MFTGLIETTGQIVSVEHKGSDVSFWIEAGSLLSDGHDLGESIAVNGVCLTAVNFSGTQFLADISVETLAITSLQGLHAGTIVNLERAIMATSRLGGHIVSGHVDALGTLLNRYADGRSERFVIEAPKSIAKYISEKGSICVDGASLTVNAIDDNVFTINIVPHTMEHTIIKNYQIGQKVNLEVDVIARYLERLITYQANDDESQNSKNNLATRFLAGTPFLK